MGQLELLWEYQQSDVEVYNLNRLIKRSPNRLRLLKLRESLKEQQGMLKGIEDEVLAMVDRTDALKVAVGMMEDQLRQLQARIQENPASSSVDVQGYMEEVARITASLDEYEQEIRSIRRNAAERDKRQRDIKVRAIRCKQEFDELRVEYDAEYQEKSEELEKLTAIAKSKREGIEPKYLERYEQIKQRCMPPMAKEIDGQCGGCNMAFPSSVLRDIKAGNPVECETCGRLIIG